MKNSDEVWTSVMGFEGLYEVSSLGRIKSLARIKNHPISGPSKTKELIRSSAANGYRKSIDFYKGGERKQISLARVVCEAFCGEKPSPLHVVRHLNGDYTDNRAENLAWGTQSENQADAKAHGTWTRGEVHGSSVLTDCTVHIIRAMRRSGLYTYRELATMFGVNKKTAMLAAKGQSWKHLPGAEQ